MFVRVGGEGPCTGLRDQISEVRELLHNQGESLQVLIQYWTTDALLYN
jgi:hypothetical protein